MNRQPRRRGVVSLPTVEGLTFEAIMEEDLRRDFIEGRIDVEAFERRLEAILRGEPLPTDYLRIMGGLPSSGATVFDG